MLATHGVEMFWRYPKCIAYLGQSFVPRGAYLMGAVTPSQQDMRLGFIGFKMARQFERLIESTFS